MRPLPICGWRQLVRAVLSCAACALTLHAATSARMLWAGGGVSVAVVWRSTQCLHKDVVSPGRRCCQMVHSRRRWRAGRRRAQPAPRLTYTPQRGVSLLRCGETAPAQFSWQSCASFAGAIGSWYGMWSTWVNLESTEELMGVCFRLCRL